MKQYLRVNPCLSGAIGFNRDAACNDTQELIEDRLRKRAETTTTAPGRCWRIEITQQTAQELQELYKQAVELPTPYFEAKPGGTVGFDQVAAFVMPESVSEDIKTALADMGVEYVLYEDGNEASRIEALNSLAHVQFKRRHTQPFPAAMEARALQHVVDNWDSLPQRIKDLKKQSATKKAKTQKALAAMDVVANEMLAARGKNTLATEAKMSYSKKKHLFKGDVFPSYKESHSDSHEVAERWSRSEEGKIQRQRLLSHHNKWYLIQVVENGVYGYQIIREVSTKDYNRGVKLHGTITRQQSVSDIARRNVTRNRGNNRNDGTGYSADTNQLGHGGENISVLGVDTDQNGRGNIESNEIGDYRSSSKDRGREYEPSVTTLQLDELSARSKWLQEQLKKERVSKDKKTEYRRELREVRREMEALMPGYYPSRDDNLQKTSQEATKPVEKDATLSNKKRGTTLSDREVLEVAALRMDTSTLTVGEKTALDIFKKRLEDLRKLQIERERLGILWREQQLGSGDRSEAPKTLNRMHVLDGQVERAVNSVLRVKDKQVLRDVLQKAREYVKEQSVAHYRGILERRKDRSTQAQLRQKLPSMESKCNTNKTKPLFCCHAPVGGGTAWTVGGSAVDYFP